MRELNNSNQQGIEVEVTKLTQNIQMSTFKARQKKLFLTN